MTKAFTKLVLTHSHLARIDQESINAQFQLEVKRKLIRFLCSKAVTEDRLQIGDLVEVILKCDSEKKSKWHTSQTVLLMNHSTGIVAAPGSFRRSFIEGFEGLRMALEKNSFA